MPQINPLNDRVVIKRIDTPKTSPGGIVIPDTASEKPIQGEVVAVGPGRWTDGNERRASSVQPGDRVLIGKYSGTEVRLDDTEYVVVREDDLLAVLA